MIGVTLYMDEKELIQKAAALQRRSVSDFSRHILLGYAEEILRRSKQEILLPWQAK